MYMTEPMNDHVTSFLSCSSVGILCTHVLSARLTAQLIRGEDADSKTLHSAELLGDSTFFVYVYLGRFC